MATKKAVEASETAETAVGSQNEAVASEPKYTVEKLREKCILLFGVSKSTFDGAMFGHSETEYTKKDAKAIIDEWLYGKEGKR